MLRFFFIFIFFLSCKSNQEIQQNKANKLVSKIDKIKKDDDIKNLKMTLRNTDLNIKSNTQAQKLEKEKGQDFTSTFFGLYDEEKLKDIEVSILQSALATENLNLIEELLKNGAEINEILDNKATLLFIVVLLCNKELFDLFLKYRADIKLGYLERDKGDKKIKISLQKYSKEVCANDYINNKINNSI